MIEWLQDSAVGRAIALRKQVLCAKFAARRVIAKINLVSEGENWPPNKRSKSKQNRVKSLRAQKLKAKKLTEIMQFS